MASLLALTGPAGTDANIQIAGLTSPVPVNSPYAYTLTVPLVAGGGSFFSVITNLSGSATTFTNVTDTASPPRWAAA